MSMPTFAVGDQRRLGPRRIQFALVCAADWESLVFMAPLICELTLSNADVLRPLQFRVIGRRHQGCIPV